MRTPPTTVVPSWAMLTHVFIDVNDGMSTLSMAWLRRGRFHAWMRGPWIISESRSSAHPASGAWPRTQVAPPPHTPVPLLPSVTPLSSVPPDNQRALHPNVQYNIETTPVKRRERDTRLRIASAQGALQTWDETGVGSTHDRCARLPTSESVVIVHISATYMRRTKKQNRYRSTLRIKGRRAQRTTLAHGANVVVSSGQLSRLERNNQAR